MARPKKKDPKAAWTYQVGVKPNTVTAYERLDKKKVVTLRWWPEGAKKYSTKSTGIYLRDERDNQVPDREAEAQAATKDAYHALLAGRTPGTLAPDAPQADPKETLTLEQGFALAFATPDGMYEDPAQPHYKEMVRYRERVLEHLPRALAWAELVPAHYTTLIRKLARAYVAQGVGGLAASGRCVIILAQAARWLAGTKKVIPYGAGLPDPKWESTLETEWARITEEPERPDPPRHSEEEMGRLLIAAQIGKADPRMRLIFQLAAEARLGQALRADYSWLDLSALGADSVGRFIIPDFVTKKGVRIDLTHETRALIDEAMTTGYLRDLEAARVAGRIKTYPLFPGGRLVDGIAPVTSLKRLGKRALIDMWHAFEMEAGVEVVKGRGWYGVRRQAADLAEDVETDERALNALTGHTTSETRQKVYQTKRRDASNAKATVARVALRELAVTAAQAAPKATTPAAPAAPSQWELTQAEKRRKRQVLHAAERAKKAAKKAAGGGD